MADESITSENTQTPSASTEQTLLSAPAEKVVEAEKNADGTPKVPVTDPTKNADGTAKSAEQIAAEKKVEDDKKTEEAKKTGAPEKYEDFKAPEGVKLAAEDLTAFSALAKEHNLSQDAAQKFIDLATKNAVSAKAAQDKAWSDARTAWVDDIKKDPEVGGANFDKSKEFAIRAVKQFGTPELNQVFSTGWGDHPALFKFCVQIGKKVSEDKLVEGSANPTAPKSAASVLYGQ